MTSPKPTIAAATFAALLAQASAQFGTETPVFGLSQVTVAIAIDGDLDGDPDIAAFNASGVSVYSENIGDGTFGAIQTMTATVPGIQRAKVADMDGDGVDDIVCTEATSPDFVWIRGLGAGQFSDAMIIAGGLPVQIARILDRDGDGDLDLLACSPTTVGWIENLGGGSFGPLQPVVSGATGLTSTHTADLDGDGILDVVVGQGSTSRVSWYRGLPGMTYGPENIITTGAGGVADVIVADLDVNGTIDVVSVSPGDSELAWFSNDGSGQFGAQQLIDNASSAAYEVREFDWNGDSLPDLIAGPRSGRYFAYENLGFGFFGVPVSVVTGGVGSHNDLDFADLDGDADLDALICNASFARVSTFENLSTLGGTYCSSTPNSSGATAALTVTGSDEAARNAIVLTTTDLPPSTFGIYATSLTPGMVVGPGGSQGVLCLGGSVGRYDGPGQILFSGPERRMRLVLDLSQMPTPNALIQATAGETWHFQSWFRDSVNGAATANFSDAVSVLLK